MIYQRMTTCANKLMPSVAENSRFSDRSWLMEAEREVTLSRLQNIAVRTNFVYTAFMRNITFSANEDLIDQARQVAHDQRKTLNDAFRDWLAQYASSRSDAAGFDEFMSRINPMRAGRRFTREEMNER
jgi:uncharacterized protein YdiU (UPF0061 family)